jgi:hypothetical protein
MSLVYPYVSLQTAGPVVTLGGRFSRPRPLIPVTLIGPKGSDICDGLLDPGADDTIFPEKVAVKIGLNLGKAPTGAGTGVGMVPLTLRFANVTFRIAQGKERREWAGWAGFTAAKIRFPLLGFAGFLQFFDANFRGGIEEVELTVNGLYPGK